MKKDNLKDYVFRKISEIEESAFPKKNDSDISGFKSDSVANLVNEIKKINKSINLLNPLMGEGFSFVEKDTIEEKSTSKKQQKFFGAVKAHQDGDVSDDDVSKKVKDASKSMSKSDVSDFASTKHKGLPEKKDESTKRNLKTPMGKEYGIEMKEGLNETITNYNKEKSISHSKESEKDSFKRLMGYSPLSED